MVPNLNTINFKIVWDSKGFRRHGNFYQQWQNNFFKYLHRAALYCFPKLKF